MAFLYTTSHYWLARQDIGQWRVGLTKFAVRMLGEMVDLDFQVRPNAPARLGQIIGWIEGFKAISDLYCIVEGVFTGGNPALPEQSTLLSQDPYGAGWLYQVSGRPDPKAVDVYGYKLILDRTIDRLQTQQPSNTESLT
jgi:glycine cleavage system H protein